MYRIEDLISHFDKSRISLISYTSGVGRLSKDDFLREFGYIEIKSLNFLQEIRNNRIDNIINDTKTCCRFSLDINPYTKDAESNKELVFQLRNWLILNSQSKDKLVLTHFTSNGWDIGSHYIYGVVLNCNLAIEITDTPNKGIKIIKNGFFTDL